MFIRSDCRICGNTGLAKFFDFGNMPLAGNYILKKDFSEEKFYPLEVYFCDRCTLVQLLHVVSADDLFRNYFYSSSVSLSKHFIDYAEEVVNKLKILPGSFIVEIGSNDGVLLGPLRGLGMKTLGVDPAINISKIAESKGLRIIKDFFNEKVASQIKSEDGCADLICANNVFAHIDNIHEIVKGIKTLLKPEGIFVFEVHYVGDLIDKLQYDTIYHEHLCYYSLRSLVYLFERFNMAIFDVERISIHSGSIRVYAANKDKRKALASVKKMLGLEIEKSLDKLDTYDRFFKESQIHKIKLNDMLKAIKKDKKEIAGYGAPGRGNTLLNYCKIGLEIINYTVDESSQRYGRYIPGMHIPIYPVDVFRDKKPDYALLLAWSYADNIFKKEKEYISKGGKFIIPMSLEVHDKSIKYEE